jgi:hypothetical protein
MARFSFAIHDQITATLLAGETVTIKNAGGTVLANTAGVPLLITNNGDGTYWVDNMPSNLITVFVGDALVAQSELTSIPWDNGSSVTHDPSTSAHGATGDITGEGDIDDSSIGFSAGYYVKALGIVEGMIADLAVTAGKIDSNAVTTAKIINDAITTAKILDANVTGVKLASAVAGDGLKKDGSDNLEVEISTVTEEVDFLFNSANQLALLKNLSSENVINSDMTLMQMLSTLDSLVQNLSVVSASSDPIVCLYMDSAKDVTPSGTSTITAETMVTSGELTYVRAWEGYVYKYPWMQQLALTAEAMIAVSGDIGNIKMTCGGESAETPDVTSVLVDPEEFNDVFGVYLDISGLANFKQHLCTVWTKVTDASDVMVLYKLALYARAFMTEFGNSGTYAVKTPVE